MIKYPAGSRVPILSEDGTKIREATVLANRYSSQEVSYFVTYKDPFTGYIETVLEFEINPMKGVK